MTTYTIEIIPFSTTQDIWYKTKVGYQYNARLECRAYGRGSKTGIIAFKITDNLWVCRDHCRVINEIKN